MKKTNCTVRFSSISPILPRLIKMAAVCAALLSVSMHAAIWSWSGGGGANAYWNNSANWGFAGIPANGDTVIFPASQPNLLNTNNIAGLTLNQIRFVGAGGGYDIRGNAFTLTNSIIATNTTGANIIENNITLPAGNLLILVSNGISLYLEGQISGTGGVNKAGLGTLIYQYLGSNLYTGTTLVSAGTLQLNVNGVTAFSGPLVIGDGTGAGNPTVQDLQSTEMYGTGPITINLNGTLDLNNHSELSNINPSLTLNGGTIETGTGTLALSPNTTITATNLNTSYIDGNLNTGSGTLTLQGNGFLWVFANVSGSAAIVQNLSGGTLWDGANTYAGNFTANGSGFVYLYSPQALGNTTNAMTLNGQTWVYFCCYNYGVTNQSLTINSTNSFGAIYVYSGSTNAWQATSFTLNTAATIFVDTNCALNLIGTIGGPGGFTKTGTGTLTLSGSTANSYAGMTIVNSGVLLLGKPYAITAVPGPLVIESGATVQLLNGFQIDNPTTPVTMYDSSLLDLNGFSEWVGPTSLQGAQITSGAGIFYFSGNITVNSSTVAQSLISGNASIWDGTYVITNSGHNFSPDLLISANVSSGGSGTPGLIKDGAGEVSLAGNNSFIGSVTINNGNLWAQTSTALGSSTNAPVTVNSGGSLFLDGIGLDFGLKPLILNGPGYFFGALQCNGSSSWEGGVTLDSDSTIYPFGGSSLTLAGAISGVGGIIEAGPGTLTYAGSAANTYAGLTTVSSGTLVLDKTIGTKAVPGNLVVSGSSSVARLGNYAQLGNSLANPTDVLVTSGGLFDCSTFYDYINTLHGNGTVNFGVSGYLLIGGNNGTSEFDGSLTGAGFTGGYTVGKFGSGTFTLTGNNTFTSGATHVFSPGKLVVNGSQPQVPAIVDSGATLGGSGTVGTIAANGIISPGNSPGILSSSNVTFSSTGNLTAELTGPNPGVGGYDQLNVTGTVSLASATLTVLPNFTTPVSIGQQFVIINNNGASPVSGTFSGLANGAQFSTSGDTFRINYNGGTGNDVVLTLLGVPGNTVTLDAVASGWYDSTGHHDPSNPNYTAQNASGTNSYRDFFVFNAPVFSGSIIHAELLINCYSNSSPNGQETYLLRRVTTPIATLEAGGSGLVGIFNDLGTDAVYSVRGISTNEAGQTAIIPLDVQFFNDATAASGGQIALGGSLSTEPTDTNNAFLFGYSQGHPTDIQLRLTFGTSEVISSADRGWYDESGSHSAGNLNYVVGDFSGPGTIAHNYFVFNLPVLSSQFVDAELLINSYTNVSPTGVETYQLYDVTNSITVLTNNASGATNIYADLGSGVVYGGRNVYVSESGMIASIPLNGSFVSAAQANSGGSIALGGALTSLNPAPTLEYLFGYSSGSVASDIQLWLGFINAPFSQPSFVIGTPTYLGNNQFQLTVSGTAGSTNEIQGSFDFNNWDFIGDLVMTNATSSLLYFNNAILPYRFFRAEQLQ